MNPLEYLTPKEITNLFTSCVGFLAALSVNGWLARRRERREFNNLLSSVATEAVSNGIVLRDSFLKNLNGGIITRPLTTICAESAISSPLFARYASKQDSETITRYFRHLLLLNGNRQLHYELTLSNDKQNQQKWMPDLVKLMRERISEGEKLIHDVSALAQ